MKKVARVLVSLIAAGFLSLSVGWWYIFHALRYNATMARTELDVNHLMMSASEVSHLAWTVVLLGVIGTAGMTWSFYRWIR
jgi:hypothetical protein